MKHDTAVKPTMYMASMYIKTAFDEAKPKHVAKILDDHNAHGWLIAASALSGMASFERWRAVSTSIDAHGKGTKEKALFGTSHRLFFVGNFWIMSHSKEHMEQMLRDLIEDANKLDLEPKPASLWWTSTHASEEPNDMMLGTSKTQKKHLQKKSKYSVVL